MARRFDDEEVALILREATRVDIGSHASDATHALDHGDGLTLAELKEIAAEAGIDPSRIEEAAQILLVRPRQSPFRVFLGTDSRIHLRSEFDESFDDAALGEALREIRSLTPLQGTSNPLPGGVEWTGRDEWGTRSVSISATSEGTSVDVLGDFDNAARAAAAAAAVAAAVGVVGVVATVASVGPLGWALAPVVAAVSVVVPRILAGRYVRREARRLTHLANRLRALRSEGSKGGTEAEDG